MQTSDDTSGAIRQNAVVDSARLAVEYPPDRACENCGGVELGLVDYGGGFWRKECLRCGSTGPFAPITKERA